MGLFSKKPKDISKNPFYDAGAAIVTYFKCNKCGELFMSHLRKYYDITVNYGQGGAAYRLDKEFIGGDCQNKIHIFADFKRNFKPINFEISGASFITKEEYEQNKK